MAVRLTFSGQNPANISNIRQQGFSPRFRPSIAPGQVFSSNNPAFSSSYGKGITLATPKGRFSIPSYNFAVGAPGSEIIQSPKQATAGMKSFDRMTERYSKTPTYDRLMKGQTVTGLGGKRFDPTELAKSFGKGALSFLSKVGSRASVPLSLLSSTELGADDEVTQEMRDSIDTTGINSLRGDPAQFSGEDPFLSETPDYTDGELYDIDDTGRIPTITDRLKGGLGSIRDTVTDKLGSVGDFIKGGGILGNILGGFGKRGDESTRGIAGLNVNDVFNVDQFGTEEDPTKDPYGINIVSAKGNYNEYVKNKARELAKMQFKTKTGKQRQDFYKQAADEIRAKEAAELKAALQRAQAEINRMGYRDYGSGGADTFDTSNIDDAGNYSDSLDPGQTE